MKSDFTARWAESPATLRREPTPTELAGGYPCGDLDLQLFNELAYRLTQAYGELSYAISASGQTPNANNLTQLWQAIQIVAQSSNIPTQALLHSGVDTSTTVNQIALSTINPEVPSLQDFQVYEVVPSNSNTGPVSLSIKTFGAIPLVRQDGAALQSGDAPAGYPFLVVKLGNAFRRLGPAPSEVGTAAATYLTQNITLVGGRILFSKVVAGTYSWTCPANTKLARIYAVGAGGAGGAGGGYAGAGGGGGNYFQGVFDVVPGSTYSIVVGAGGTGGSGAGGNGGSTFIKRPDGSTIAICFGGSGGGAGGNPATNNIGINGPNPGYANNTFPYGGYELLASIAQQGIILPGPTNIGGLGSGSPMSSGTVQPYNGGGFAGNSPGGGASGASANSSGPNGADGALFIEG